MPTETTIPLWRTLAEADPEIAGAIRDELNRQNSGLELIASENFVSRAILEAAGSVFTNKYAEGYPGRRYYGGCEWVDVVERAAIARAKALFGADHANVQPHSGAQANMAVYFALLKPGDTVLGMNLSHGGHLTHGHPLNFSGKLYTIVPYGVRKEDERIDYDELDAARRRAQAEDDHGRRQRLPARHRLRADSRRRRSRRRRRRHRHGAHRRARRRRHPSESGAALRFRHDDHAQDAQGTTSRNGAVQGTVREGPRQERVSRRAGRPARAHHRGESGVFQGSGGAGVRRVPAPDCRERDHACRRAVGGGLPSRERRHRQSSDARRRLLDAASPASSPRRRSGRPASPSTRTRFPSIGIRRSWRAASASERRP